MRKLFAIHPDNPQARLLRHAATVIDAGRVIVYPTDSGYALGCKLGNKSAVERIRNLRNLSKHHNMTLICRDLSQLSMYAHVSNPVFRLLKAFTPGASTFILKATSDVPRLMLHAKRKTLGLRVPANTVTRVLLECMETPMVSTSLILPDATTSLAEPEAIRDLLGDQIDLILDIFLISMHQLPFLS